MKTTTFNNIGLMSIVAPNRLCFKDRIDTKKHGDLCETNEFSPHEDEMNALKDNGNEMVDKAKNRNIAALNLLQKLETVIGANKERKRIDALFTDSAFDNATSS